MRGKLCHQLKQSVVLLEALDRGGNRARLIANGAQFSGCHKCTGPPRPEKAVQATVTEGVATREEPRALVTLIERIITDGALQPLELVLHVQPLKKMRWAANES